MSEAPEGCGYEGRCVMQPPVSAVIMKDFRSHQSVREAVSLLGGQLELAVQKSASAGGGSKRANGTT